MRIAQMLGLNKDPSHFLHISPVTAEIRRRLWWHVLFQDSMIALAAGLPPLIDDSSWDVKPVSEAKDHLIGTSEITEYEKEVAEGKREPMLADSPDDPNQPSLVSTSGIFAVGKHLACGE